MTSISHSRTSCWANNIFVLKVRTSFIRQYGGAGRGLLPSIGVTGLRVNRAATGSGATSATGHWRKRGVWLVGQKLRTVLVGQWHQEEIVTVEGLQWGIRCRGL